MCFGFQKGNDMRISKGYKKCAQLESLKFNAHVSLAFVESNIWSE